MHPVRIAGLWQNVRSRTWRTRGVVGGDILDTQPLPVELSETLGKSIPQSGEFITRFINVAVSNAVNYRQLPQT